MPVGTYLKKWYKSPFPACNIHCQNEPIVTDTVYSDILAINGSFTAAQFFDGTESLVCNIYPMKMYKQFVNVLQNNIRRQGAMSNSSVTEHRLKSAAKCKILLETTSSKIDKVNHTISIKI